MNAGTYTYPTTVTAGPDRYHAVTSTSTGDAFSYDVNGNMVVRTVDSVTQRLTYDSRNRADTLLAPNAAARYGFDAEGTRVVRAEYGTPNSLGAAVQAAAPRVLLVVAAPAALTTGETTLRNRLIGDGYTVTNHDDGSAAPAVSTYDVVVLSPTVVTATVGTKYREVARPVVNLAPGTWVNNELVSVTPASAATTRARVDTATHPVAQALLAGTDVTVSSSQVWSYADDAQLNASADRVWNWRPATGTTTFATRNTVFVYDTGDTLDNAAPAPATRVAVGTSTGALNGLTAAGLNLVANAINYGTGPAVTVTLPGWEQHRYATSTVQVTNYSHGGHQIGYRRSNGTFSEYHQTYSDQVGSTSGVMDFIGNVFHHLTMRYGPYGNTLPGSANPTTDHHYTGQTNDRATGLYHYGYRNYDPVTARFTQPDSIIPGIANPQNLNRYTYVNNNPVTHNDPTGHSIPIGAHGSESVVIPHCVAACNSPGGSGGASASTAPTGESFAWLLELEGGFYVDLRPKPPTEIPIDNGWGWLDVLVEFFVVAAVGTGVGVACTAGLGTGPGAVVTCGAAAGAAGQITSNGMNDQEFTHNVVQSSIIGGVTAGLLYGLGQALARNAATTTASGAIDDFVGAACRTNSFVPGTLVLMADGSTKPIEEVKVGDWVWAADPETGEEGPRQVVDTIVGEGQRQLVDIEVLGDRITATEGHPFWVSDQERWVDAGELRAGDLLLLADGSTATVSQVEERVGVLSVHNLTVDDIHTYFVATDDAAILVHNCTIGQKIRDQMIDRGWTDDLVDEVVDNPTFTHNVWDLTSDSAATAYARGDNFYVVVNDATGEVVQISDRLDGGWAPVWTDPRFDPPG